MWRTDAEGRGRAGDGQGDWAEGCCNWEVMGTGCKGRKFVGLVPYSIPHVWEELGEIN